MQTRRSRSRLVAACTGVLAATLLVLTGCGPASTADSSHAATNVGLALDAGGEQDSGSNDLAGSGLYLARTRLGVDGKDASPNSDGTNREAILNSLVASRHNPVVAVGPAYASSLAQVASKHPDTTFAIVDDSVGAVPVPGSNVTNLTFAVEQGSYLVGVAAARKSVTGRFGFVGSAPTDEVKRYLAGFTAGVHSVKPHAPIDVSYIAAGSDPSAARAGASSPETARERATTMLSNGDDIIFQAAGDSGEGITDAVLAARESGKRGVWTIGSDGDEYDTASDDQQRVILTSVVPRVDTAVYHYVRDHVDGKKLGGTREFDLKEKGVAFALSGGYLADISSELERDQKAIVAGKITVPSTV